MVLMSQGRLWNGNLARCYLTCYCENLVHPCLHWSLRDLTLRRCWTSPGQVLRRYWDRRTKDADERSVQVIHLETNTGYEWKRSEDNADGQRD